MSDRESIEGMLARVRTAGALHGLASKQCTAAVNAIVAAFDALRGENAQWAQTIRDLATEVKTLRERAERAEAELRMREIDPLNPELVFTRTTCDHCGWQTDITDEVVRATERALRHGASLAAARAPLSRAKTETKD